MQCIIFRFFSIFCLGGSAVTFKVQKLVGRPLHISRTFPQTPCDSIFDLPSLLNIYYFQYLGIKYFHLYCHRETSYHQSDCEFGFCTQKHILPPISPISIIYLTQTVLDWSEIESHQGINSGRGGRAQLTS